MSSSFRWSDQHWRDDGNIPRVLTKNESFSTIRFWVFVGENGNLYYYIYISMFMIYYQSIYYIYIFLYITSFVNFVSIQIQPAPVQGFPSGWDGMGCLKRRPLKSSAKEIVFPSIFPSKLLFKGISGPFSGRLQTRFVGLFYSTTQIWWTLRWGRWGSNAFD